MSFIWEIIGEKKSNVEISNLDQDQGWLGWLTSCFVSVMITWSQILKLRLYYVYQQDYYRLYVIKNTCVAKTVSCGKMSHYLN